MCECQAGCMLLMQKHDIVYWQVGDAVADRGYTYPINSGNAGIVLLRKFVREGSIFPGMHSSWPFVRSRRLSLSAGLCLGCLPGRRGRSWGRGRGGAAPRSVASPHRGRARPSCTPLSFVARRWLRPWPAAACRSPFALSTLARCPLPTNAASGNQCRLQRAAYR